MGDLMAANNTAQIVTPISKLMSSPVFVLGATSPVRMAVNEMMRREIGAIVIIDKGRIIGMFTERDLLKKVVGANKDPNITPLNEVMTHPVSTITSDTQPDQALQIMQVGKFRHLPVIAAGGAPIGMISLRDLLFQKIEDILLNKIAGQLRG